MTNDSKLKELHQYVTGCSADYTLYLSRAKKFLESGRSLSDDQTAYQAKLLQKYISAVQTYNDFLQELKIGNIGYQEQVTD